MKYKILCLLAVSNAAILKANPKESTLGPVSTSVKMGLVIGAAATLAGVGTLIYKKNTKNNTANENKKSENGASRSEPASKETNPLKSNEVVTKPVKDVNATGTAKDTGDTGVKTESTVTHADDKKLTLNETSENKTINPENKGPVAGTNANDADVKTEPTGNPDPKPATPTDLNAATGTNPIDPSVIENLKNSNITIPNNLTRKKNIISSEEGSRTPPNAIKRRGSDTSSVSNTKIEKIIAEKKQVSDTDTTDNASIDRNAAIAPNPGTSGC